MQIPSSYFDQKFHSTTRVDFNCSVLFRTLSKNKKKKKKKFHGNLIENLTQNTELKPVLLKANLPTKKKR